MPPPSQTGEPQAAAGAGAGQLAPAALPSTSASPSRKLSTLSRLRTGSVDILGEEAEDHGDWNSKSKRMSGRGMEAFPVTLDASDGFRTASPMSSGESQGRDAAHPQQHQQGALDA